MTSNDQNDACTCKKIDTNAPCATGCACGPICACGDACTCAD